MRLGGPIHLNTQDPAEWIAAHERLGYRAAYCPVSATDSDEKAQEFARAAKSAVIVIAEVGAWCNPIGTDDNVRRKGISYCQAQLALADRIGARCCVNGAGYRSAEWDRPGPENVTEETFDLIVETVREIIDAVRPSRTFYTLEAMPWVYPDSPESYARLIEAIDRERFGAHLDPVNMVTSPRRCFDNGALLRECFALLGPHIKSCHAKDVRFGGGMTVHIEEARPGTGVLDYATFLREMARLDADTPLMLEHLSTEDEYALAADYIRSVARDEKLPL